LGGCPPLPRTRTPAASSGSSLASLASLAGSSKKLKLPKKKKSPQLSPVSQLFLGMGEVSPDIYAIMRLEGRAPVADVAYVMQQLSDAHERFRMRVALRGGTWCTEVCCVVVSCCVWTAAFFLNTESSRCRVSPNSSSTTPPTPKKLNTKPPKSKQIVEDFDVNWCMRQVTLDGDDIDAAFNAFVARVRWERQ
jgi:hypothetical protein